MKTRTYVAIAVTLLVVLAGGALVLTNSRAASQSLMIPVTGVEEALPASLDDYTPEQRARYQITELIEPLAIPVTGRVESLPASIDDYTPAQRAQYQITEPIEPMAIPVTGKVEVVPSSLDVAQQDEVAKLAAYPIIFPPFTGELDVAQQDEVNKLGP